MKKIEKYKVLKQCIPYLYLDNTGIFLYYPNESIADWKFKKQLISILCELQKITLCKLNSFVAICGNDIYYPMNEVILTSEYNDIDDILNYESSIRMRIFDDAQLLEIEYIFDNDNSKIKTDIYGNEYIYKNGKYVESSDIDSKLIFRLTLFGGWFGLHYFYQKKISSGLIYLFTFGLFGFGWFFDLLSLIMGYTKDKEGLYLLPINNKKVRVLFLLIPLIFIPISFKECQVSLEKINSSVSNAINQNIDEQKIQGIVDDFEAMNE